MRPSGEGGNASVVRVERAVGEVPAGRYLLAISGGRDSMVLLDAWLRVRSDAVAVASFDHGTGPSAAEAVLAVRRRAASLGIPVVAGLRPPSPDHPPGEAELRESRQRFLRAHATQFRARVVTAHSADDQAETVCMRILRDAGVRGLAGMRAEGAAVRPLLDVSRAEIAAYAEARGVTWVEDPSNAARIYFRNRVRHDLLPALERVRPGFREWLLELGESAARVRAGIRRLVDDMGVHDVSSADGTGATRAVFVRAGAFATLPPQAVALVWQEVVARAGVTVDWRGTERLSSEWAKLKPGNEIPLAGGAVVIRTETTFVVRNRGGTAPLY